MWPYRLWGVKFCEAYFAVSSCTQHSWDCWLPWIVKYSCKFNVYVCVTFHHCYVCTNQCSWYYTVWHPIADLMMLISACKYIGGALCQPGIPVKVWCPLPLQWLYGLLWHQFRQTLEKEQNCHGSNSRQATTCTCTMAMFIDDGLQQHVLNLYQDYHPYINIFDYTVHA